MSRSAVCMLFLTLFDDPRLWIVWMSWLSKKKSKVIKFWLKGKDIFTWNAGHLQKFLCVFINKKAPTPRETLMVSSRLKTFSFDTHAQWRAGFTRKSVWLLSQTPLKKSEYCCNIHCGAEMLNLRPTAAWPEELSSYSESSPTLLQAAPVHFHAVTSVFRL